MLYRLYEISTITSVGIDSSDPGKSHDKHSHKSICGFGIVSVGRSGGCLQYVTVLIRYYIALHALDLLIPVNSLLRTRLAGARARTVNDTYGGLCGFASSESDLFHQTVFKFRERIHRAPAPEVVIYCLPLGIFLRQQPPLASADIYKDNRIKYEEKSYLLRQFSVRIVPFIYSF